MKTKVFNHSTIQHLISIVVNSTNFDFKKNRMSNLHKQLHSVFKRTKDKSHSQH